MAFRKPEKQPQFADLKGILAQSKQTENPLYQTIQILIERLDQMQGVTADQLVDINNSINNSQTVISITANKKATYLTTENEKIDLPNSVQLLAGYDIIFDDSIPNQRTIRTMGLSSHYDSPLSDGDLVEANLIYAAGECIIVQVPI